VPIGEIERRIARQDQPGLGEGTPEQPHPLPNVLVALKDLPRAGFVARGLRAGGLVPVLAFDERVVTFCLTRNRFVLLLLEADLAPAVLGEAGRSSEDAELAPPLLIVGERKTGLSADVYLRADASVEEISARATALVRISRPVRLPVPSIVQWGPLQLDLRRRQAQWLDRAVKLTTVQSRIMEVLVLATGAVVSHRDLARRVWGSESFDDAERLAAHVRRIRRIVEPAPGQPPFLLTIRGEDFRLSDHDIVEGSIDLRD